MADQTSGTSLNSNQVVQGIKYVFGAVADTSIKNFTWIFSDGNVTVNGKYAIHEFKSTPPAQVTVRLVGLDRNNVSHEVSIALNVIWGTDLIKPISVTASGNSLYTAVVAIPKAIYGKITLSATQPLPFIVGEVNSPTPKAWSDSLVFITAADTNTNVIKNSNGSFSLSVPASGQIGDHVVIRMTLPANDYKMGTGRVNKNGVAEYANFTGSPYATVQNPTIIHFSLSATGISPYSTPNQEAMPGEFGDKYVRGSLLTTKAVIYTRLESTFTSGAPFIQNMDTSGNLVIPSLSLPVPGFPNWAATEIPYSELADVNYRRLHYGINISMPNAYSVNEPLSDFYDKSRKILGIGFIQATLNKSVSGKTIIGQGNGWMIVPYK